MGTTISGRDAAAGPRSTARPDLAAVALVGLGGAAGTLARYLLGAALPWSGNVSVFAMNVAGTLLLGFLMAAWAGRMPRLRLLLGTGFCGGFTTYSALAVGVAELAQAGGGLAGALVLAFGTIVAAGLAAVLGVWLGGKLAASNRVRPLADGNGAAEWPR